MTNTRPNHSLTHGLFTKYITFTNSSTNIQDDVQILRTKRISTNDPAMFNSLLALDDNYKKKRVQDLSLRIVQRNIRHALNLFPRNATGFKTLPEFSPRCPLPIIEYTDKQKTKTTVRSKVYSEIPDSLWSHDRRIHPRTSVDEINRKRISAPHHWHTGVPVGTNGKHKCEEQLAAVARAPRVAGTYRCTWL